MSERLIAGIEMAIRLEQKGLDFYEKCMSQTRRQEAKELFDFLIKAEKTHKAGLESVKKGVLKNSPEVIQKGVDKVMKLKIPVPLFSDSDLAHMLKSTTNLRMMFNKAMELEKEGMGFYFGMAVKEEDALLKSFWKKLGSDELKHKQEIERVGFIMLGIPKWEVL